MAPAAQSAAQGTQNSCKINQIQDTRCNVLFSLKLWKLKHRRAPKCRVFQLQMIKRPCSRDKTFENKKVCFWCSSKAEHKKQFACLLERGLRCNTYSTEDALLPEVEEAALGGWCRPCAHCDGTRPARSAWRPLAAHCPSGLEEKHTFVTNLQRFAPLPTNGHVRMHVVASNLEWGVSESKQMSETTPGIYIKTMWPVESVLFI